MELVESLRLRPARTQKAYKRVSSEVHRKAWTDALSEYGNLLSGKRSPVIQNLVRLGIPHDLRREIWPEFCGANQKRRQVKSSYYHDLLRHFDGEESAATRDIEKDIDRTGLAATTEAGKAQLKRVLVAYSWRNPKVGYLQSMNFLCGLLLMFCDEESAFWVLACIVEDLLPGYYSGNLVEGQVDLCAFDDLVQQYLPTIFGHLRELHVELRLIITEWLLSLYTSLPLEVAVRVWDVFLSEGVETLFRVGMAMLKLNEAELLKTDDSSEAFTLLKSLGRANFDPDELLYLALHDYSVVNKEGLDRLRLKHRGTVINDTEERRRRRARQDMTIQEAEATCMKYTKKVTELADRFREFGMTTSILPFVEQMHQTLVNTYDTCKAYRRRKEQQQQQQQQQQKSDLDQTAWQDELCSPTLTGHLPPALAIVVAAVYCACTTCISGSWNSALALSRSNLSGGSWLEPRCPDPSSIRLCAEGVDTFRSAAEELSDHIKHLALPSSYDSRTAYIQESIVQLRQEQDHLREFIVNAYGSNQFLPTD